MCHGDGVEPRRPRGTPGLIGIIVAGTTSARRKQIAENGLHRVPSHIEAAVEGGEDDQVLPLIIGTCIFSTPLDSTGDSMVF